MSGLQRLTVACLFALAACSIPAVGAVAQTAGGAIQLPTIPDPVAVTLDASSTAFLALDFNSTVCANTPACVATLPAVAAGLSAARTAGALIAYSSTPNATVLPDVLQLPDDPVVTSSADKFFNTNLDDVLKQRRIATVVLTGTITNGAILYTGFAAAARGYTVVIAADGVSARSDFANFAAEWQLLNGPGTSNPQNTPLQPKAATLSRMDLITYR
jgi:nicotinamidase-related amidase